VRRHEIIPKGDFGGATKYQETSSGWAQPVMDQPSRHGCRKLAAVFRQPVR